MYITAGQKRFHYNYYVDILQELKSTKQDKFMSESKTGGVCFFSWISIDLWMRLNWIGIAELRFLLQRSHGKLPSIMHRLKATVRSPHSSLPNGRRSCIYMAMDCDDDHTVFYPCCLCDVASSFRSYVYRKYQNRHVHSICQVSNKNNWYKEQFQLLSLQR